MASSPWTKLFEQVRELFQPDDPTNKQKSGFPTASQEPRTIYVNTTIPADELDDYGQPSRSYLTNKIRTAKYTWYTFLPKNLFEQFRGIANLYFLFLVILQMFPLFSTSASPVLVVLPLAAILIITGVKDAFEDNKRHKTDMSVNKAATYTLSDWTNVNVPVYKVAWWRRASYALTRPVRDLFKKKEDPFAISRMSTMHSALQPLDTNHLDLPSSPSKASSLREHLQPFKRVFKKKSKRKMPYRPGQIPHSVLRRSSKPKADKKAKLRGSIGRQPVDKRWKRTRWQDLRVGDFVYLREDDAVPADLVVLSSSEPDGLCYVETQNLDGETNLKIMRSLQATNEINTIDDCKKSQFFIESEPPHANLYSYNGVLKWKVEIDTTQEQEQEQGQELKPPEPIYHNTDAIEAVELDLVHDDQHDDDDDNNDDDDDDDEVSHQKTEAITSSNVLLRGCVLRNTGWVIGLVLFTGNETKIMLNSGKTPSKRSKIEKATNPHVIANFVLLFILCLVCSIAASVVFSSHTSSTYFEQADAETATMEGFLMFWTTLVIYQNIIPISLYISVQIVKTAAAYFIHTDLDMYNERLDQPCVPKTWNISDDLGQIEYIFSDKTGTLTQNIMEFRRCTVNGVVYGLGETEASLGAKKRDNPNADHARAIDNVDMDRARAEMLRKQAELFDHAYMNPHSSFVDPKVYDNLGANNAHSQSLIHFFSALALCHTVIPEHPDPNNLNNLVYKAQSPDEAALVATARDIGFTFVAREQDTIVMDALGEERRFTLLNVLEFNSTRKRMSVILRSPQDGSVVLLCKGADSVIYERLSESQPHQDEQMEGILDQKQMRQETLAHLGVFANEGLRTLCIASRMLSEDEYQQWAERYKAAASSIHNRDEQIEKVCEEIERDLTLIGGTAIEDKLQEGVPETIGVLAQAGIKIWVLTGDKIETAINIGFACNLLTKDMLLISVNARDEQDTMAQLQRSLEQVKTQSQFQKCALVIDGDSLKFGLEMPCRQVLLELGTRCMAVICCRVSPMQKAKVVNMVKKGLKVMTLAIGDGANDVSMIQEANVGIGISGEEGRQAVMASDYAIGQFRYLSKLLLVHGRWSYLRTSEMILTFFYKNIMWTLVLFWYQLFCGFSGTMMFDYSYITLYNLVFTSLPCIFAGVLDQDLTANYSYKYPQLYLMGIRNDKFKISRFYLTVVDAIYQSAICFGVPYMCFIDGKMSSQGYDTEGVYELGTFIAGIAVVVANALVGFTIFSWTWVMVLVIGLSSATFFIWTAVYAQVMSFNFYGEDMLFREGTFWLCLVVTFVICMMPRYVTKYYLHMSHPFDNDIVREMVLCRSAASDPLNKMKRRTKTPLEEEVPINLERTQSESTAFKSEHTADDLYYDEEQGGYHLAHPLPVHHGRIDRSATSASGKTEIMNMSSGKRTSFTGFAFATDDSSPFRRSVYRHLSLSSPRARSSVATLPSTAEYDLAPSEPAQDWMPLEGFRLRRYETAPADASHSKKKINGGLPWKVMKAMKQRMSPRPDPHPHLNQQQTPNPFQDGHLLGDPFSSDGYRSLASSASDLQQQPFLHTTQDDTELVDIPPTRKLNHDNSHESR